MSGTDGTYLKISALISGPMCPVLTERMALPEPQAAGESESSAFQRQGDSDHERARGVQKRAGLAPLSHYDAPNALHVTYDACRANSADLHGRKRQTRR